MAGARGKDLSFHRRTHESKVTDKVEKLVTSGFVFVAKRFVVQNSRGAEYDRFVDA